MNMKEKFESTAASKWLEKAEQAYPYEKQVIEFKERLYNLFETSSQTQDWEQFLLKGIDILLLLQKNVKINSLF